MGRSTAWEDIVGAPETDPQAIRKAKEMLGLESRVHHSAVGAESISVADREKLAKWAYDALLRGPDWQGNRAQMMRVLDNLKHDGYPDLANYADMHGKEFVDYFDKVCRKISGDVIVYCWDIGVEIRAKNREARMEKGRTS